MILTGNEIINRVSLGEIDLKPFDITRVTTNSYDLTLGEKLICYTSDTLDPTIENEYIEIEIPEEGILLEGNSFYLGSSSEIVGSDKFVPIIHAKSGIARLGLFVHVTADLIDIGSHGNVTFQLYATLPMRLYKT